MLANAATPTLGLVDTAVMGHSGTVTALAALALGALSFNFLYWGFGFLRMGTTGRVALLRGAQDAPEVLLTGLRALLLGFACGVLLWLMREPIAHLAAWALQANRHTESLTQLYLKIRLCGAPAALATFALLGWMIGMGRTREVLAVQLVLNAVNIVLDLYWGWWQQQGLVGIAWGTVVAEWSGLAWALWRCHQIPSGSSTPWPSALWAEFWNRSAWRALVRANGDLLLRSLLMLGCFGYFLNMAAQQGSTALAATHVLLQFVTLSAYVLDGFAHAAEPLVGKALGARQWAEARSVVRRSWLLSQLAAAIFALVIISFSPLLLRGITDLAGVQDFARQHHAWTALYVLVSASAFQLDGIFIGAGATAAMRNSALVSALTFAACASALAKDYAGLWASFVLYVVVRGLTLAAVLPRLLRDTDRTR